MNIRQAVAADAAQIARVHVQSWRETYRGMLPDDLLDRLDVDRRCAFWRSYIDEATSDKILLVAEDDAGEVVGFVSGSRTEGEFSEQYDCDLRTIYLLQAAQGQGVGRKLVEAFAQAAYGQGYRSMILWALADNTRSRGFYEHMGGEWIMEGQFTVGGNLMNNVAYGWSDLATLITNT